MNDDRNWLVTKVDDCLWWVMVEEGVWLQHMIDLDVLRWLYVDDDRNWLVTTVNGCLWWVMVDVGGWPQNMIGQSLCLFLVFFGGC